MVDQQTIAHPTVRRLFAGRKMIVATMHGKELVMKPLIRQYLGLNSVEVPRFDTDQFGTFTGEVERPYDAITTLRKKILKGLSVSGEKLGIGNEGSFGPHPTLPFVQADQEFVMLIDLEHDIEVVEHVISTETNFAREEIKSVKELVAFADKINFPFHGLILKQVKNDKVVAVRKGILHWEQLYSCYLQLASTDTTLYAEPDMRGFLNPTRMKNIERATQLLMRKVLSLCPSCQWPGFGCVETKAGLPCSQCGEETSLALSKVYQCKRCEHTDERMYPKGKFSDPMFCNHCNP